MSNRRFLFRIGPALCVLCFPSVRSAAAPGLGTSHPVLGPTVEEHQMADVPLPERELALAVDPRDPQRLMAVANVSTPCGRVHKWYASSDGGRTFALGEVPIGTRLKVDTVENKDVEFSDPWLAYGSDGTVYHSAIAHGKSTEMSLVVQASSDQGRTWTDPADGEVAKGQHHPWFSNDKESIAVDRAKGDNVYVVWNVPSSKVTNSPPGIYFSRDPGGHRNGFNFPPPTKPLYAAGQCNTYAPNIVVTASGKIFVAWTRFCSGNGNGAPGEILVMKSSDHGNSFDDPVRAAKLLQAKPLDVDVGSMRSASHVSIASDPVSSRVFLAYATDGKDHAHASIEVVSSLDGVHWEAPVQLNRDATRVSQVQPAIAVGGGRVVVNFVTTGDTPQAFDDHFAYAAVAPSPSFTEIRLSKQSSPQPTSFLGDYTAVAVGSDGVAHAAWTDQRTGGGPGADTDAYGARVVFQTVAQHRPPAILGSVPGPLPGTLVRCPSQKFPKIPPEDIEEEE